MSGILVSDDNLSLWLDNLGWHEPECNQVLCTCGYYAAVHRLELAIEAARRAAEWRKVAKVGDRVRLVAMPEIGGVIAIRYNDIEWIVDWDNNQRTMRHVMELMPEEG